MATSRKDLLKAQSFTTQRLVNAFVDRDPDQPSSPLRRMYSATFVGVLIGIILVAGNAIFGLIRPGNSNAWREKQGVIQDINSGALFIYVPDQGKDGDGLLLPMADIASARLAAGTTTVTTVKTKKLQGIQQDYIRGIPDAPRQLPAAAEIKPYPLRLCASPTDTAGQRYLTMEVGQGITHTLDDDISVVIKTNEDSYLLMDGVYHKLWRKGSSSVVELDLPVVTSAETRRGIDYWLAAQPVGQPIEPFRLENFGGVPSTRQAQPDLPIGHLAMVRATDINEAQYFIQTADGLARTTYLNMRTELAANERQSQPTPIDASVAAANMSERTPELRTPGVRFGPPTAPRDATVGPDHALCATYADPATVGRRTTPIITLGDPIPELPAGISKRPPNVGYVDYMKVAPLRGALLENMDGTPGMEGDSSSWLILGDRRYGIPTLADREALGYPPPSKKGGATVVQVPGMFIRLIPDGLKEGAQLTQESIEPPLPPLPK